KSTAVAKCSLPTGAISSPKAYPEAGPQHPSYPSGHATMAGACATILKAAFDGAVQFNTLPDGEIVMAQPDGGGAMDYPGPDNDQITINGEINTCLEDCAGARLCGNSLAVGCARGTETWRSRGSQRSA